MLKKVDKQFVGLVYLYINHFCLFNSKSRWSLYIKYVWSVNEYFVGNIISKQAWAHLFAYS